MLTDGGMPIGDNDDGN